MLGMKSSSAPIMLSPGCVFEKGSGPEASNESSTVWCSPSLLITQPELARRQQQCCMCTLRHVQKQETNEGGSEKLGLCFRHLLQLGLALVGIISAGVLLLFVR